MALYPKPPHDPKPHYKPCGCFECSDEQEADFRRVVRRKAESMIESHVRFNSTPMMPVEMVVEFMTQLSIMTGVEIEQRAAYIMGKAQWHFENRIRDLNRRLTRLEGEKAAMQAEAAKRTVITTVPSTEGRLFREESPNGDTPESNLTVTSTVCQNGKP